MLYFSVDQAVDNADLANNLNINDTNLANPLNDNNDKVAIPVIIDTYTSEVIDDNALLIDLESPGIYTTTSIARTVYFLYHVIGIF